MKKIAIIIMLILLLGGCSEPPKISNDGRIRIVTTIFPEYDLVRAITSDKAEVSMLTPLGASTHSFDPTPGDIKAIENADIFIYAGGESDGWVPGILESVDVSDKTILKLTDGLELLITDELDEHEEHEHSIFEYDEHIWSSPKNAIILVGMINDALCEKDEQNSAFYRKNTELLVGELTRIDDELTRVVTTAKRKKIAVADRFPFRYLTKHYGIEYISAFEGCSDQTDVNVKDLAAFMDVIELENIQFVFHAELSNKNIANAVSEQTGAEQLQLNSGQNISKTDFDKGTTYIMLMEQNVENLEKGLN